VNGPTTVTDTGGDRSSGTGVIAAYEAAYFTARDPKAALDVTDRGPGVPSQARLADAIATLAPNTPWCVSITDSGNGHFATQVTYQPKPDQPGTVMWLLDITVTTDPAGVHTIVNITDKAPH
jgi:hypothetical protein